MGRILRGRMKRLISAVLIFSSVLVYGQDKYWIFFRDKAGVYFDPYEYFDSKAIDRRIKLNLPLYDVQDLPLNQNYIRGVTNITNSHENTSRWLNAISVNANTKALSRISELSYVSHIEPVTLYSNISKIKKRRVHSFRTNISDDEKELLQKQVSVLGEEEFEKNGLDGKGIRIAVFDGGFPGVDKSPVFEHLRNENRIVGTYDFVKETEFVYSGMSHGTMVLSCISGILDGQKMGLATGAEFLLARTEVNLETFSEEENWLAAVEWADKNGADIINSSLGYTYHRYFSKDMDGRTTLVSRAANIAAKKGILVVNAMGNDGNNHWEVLGAPADADSVLSVGGIDPETHFHIYFSSFGPTADKRLKPNVSAYGEAMVADKRKIRKAFGTSFAAPLVTGFAACAWQSNPNFSNMDVFREVQKSGSLYPYYDYAHGFGIPKASYFTDTMKQMDASFDFNIVDNFVHVVLQENPPDDLSDFVYYHVKKQDGGLKKYAVVVPEQKKVLSFALDELKNKTLTVHYKGYTKEFKH